MKKIFFSLCIALNFLAMHVMAQVPGLGYIPTVFPKSPNSAAFDKYGDYPVSYFSGVPSISIPLYTVDAGGLKVPITLSYHASGLKVDEASGWVGSGWSVSTGGSVTRNIMGLDDARGYFGGYKGIKSLNTFTHGGLDSLYNVIYEHNVDMRPDIYNYNLPGYSGKFFFNGKDALKPILIPYAPLLIKGSGGFDITDEHGNKYSLGKTYTEDTETWFTSGSGNTAAPTAWMLESMISQNRRDTISFSYQTQNIGNPDQTGETVSVEDEEVLTGGVSAGTNGCPITYAPLLPQKRTANTASAVNEQEIQHINFKNGRVDFILSAARRLDLTGNVYSLDSVKIYAYNFSSKKLELQKSIKFYKSYFTGFGGSQGKLRLDSVQFSDKSGASQQRYRFKYNTQPIVSSGSFSKDFWGYYNGKMDGNISNKTLVPRTKVYTNRNGIADSLYIGADNFGTRLPDSNYMQAGVLDTIYCPTGGRTIFTYQTNRYIDDHGVTQLTGGLRVSSIARYDNISATPVIKTYQYNTALANFITATGGEQLATGFFSHTQNYRLWVYVTDPTRPDIPGYYAICKTKRVQSFTSDPGYSLTPNDGNPVAYTTVTEYTGTPTGNIGKTVYNFNYSSDYFQSMSSSGIPISFDYSFARGQMIQKSEYLRKANGTYQIVKRDTNAYAAFALKNYSGVGTAVGQLWYNDGVLSRVYHNEHTPDDTFNITGGDYAIATQDNYLISSKSTIYDLADTTKKVSSTIIYNYGSDTTHQQIISTTHIDSRGNTRTTNYKYAFNYPAGNSIIDSMVNRHMWADHLEQSETYTIAGTAKTTSAQLNQFKVGAITNTIVPDKVSILNITAPVTNFTASSVASGALIKDSRYTQVISFDAYDSQNNLQQYTPRSSTPVSIKWDYLFEKPVVQAKNTTAGYISYTSFEADGTGNFSYASPTLTDPTAPTGNRVYNLAGGSVTSSAMNTAKTYVLSLWSNNGAPTVASLTGTPLRTTGNWTYYEYAVPAGTSSIAISGTTTIDELRLYPADAQMATYAYSTDGVTDMADTKGSINHFDYDAFSRLKNAKDWMGNIVKNYGYHTYDQVHGNTAQGPATYTRNNCPSGTTPGSTTYSVPANKYYAVTTADANAEAAYDMNVNGQIKANITCGCPIHYVSFTLSNSSGNTGFQVTFSGIATPFNFPSSGSTVISVPEGTYATVSTALRSFNSTYTLGARTPVVGHNASFSNVVVATGSSDLTLSITP